MQQIRSLPVLISYPKVKPSPWPSHAICMFIKHITAELMDQQCACGAPGGRAPGGGGGGREHTCQVLGISRCASHLQPRDTQGHTWVQ